MSRIELSYKGIGELLRSEGMRSVVSQKAKEVYPDKEFKIYKGFDRIHAYSRGDKHDPD